MYTYLISAAELEQEHRSDWLVFDVRHDLMNPQAGRSAYLQGHIPGARFLDNDSDLVGKLTGKNGRHPLPERDKFADLMRQQGLESQTQVVIYDAGNSMFAARLWWMLRWLGHEKVAILDGGWQAWVAENGKVETDVSQASAEPSQWEESANPDMPTVQAAEILTNIEQPHFVVVDARAGERFRGEVEPIDPVAGHIPGAINRPNSANLQADGRFKPVLALRAEFASLLAGRPADQVVHQCGSGITACHNLFAMELAGMNGSKLYPGSWSEWVSDPSRPVAVGDA
ncbi:sulfurtransferase [Paenalcaligenes sp. Me131]|uniref:sulfurtransferase n=1 Tax=Paenalcaligenes sp. Me131 TaxID=3392636 RepID=UPI003D2B41D3